MKIGVAISKMHQSSKILKGKISMIKKTFTLHSKYDNLPLSVLVIAPENAPKGIIQFVHGMAEYKNRYEEMMSFFAEKGYVCVCHDHRGHGESLKNKEDRGWFGDYDGEAVVDDTVLVTEYIKKEYPNLPLTLFGHSMGALIVRCYAQEHDELIDKLIVCGSPSKNPLSGVAIFLEKTIRLFCGARHRSKLLAFLSTGKGDKLFPGEAEKAWLCANRASVEKYVSDENCGFVFTCNGYENLFKLLRRTYQKKRYQVKNSTLSIHFLAGEKDTVIVSEAAWQNAVEEMRKVGYQTVTAKLYEGMRHEVHNEADNQIVYEDLLAFVNA